MCAYIWPQCNYYSRQNYTNTNIMQICITTPITLQNTQTNRFFNKKIDITIVTGTIPYFLSAHYKPLILAILTPLQDLQPHCLYFPYNSTNYDKKKVNQRQMLYRVENSLQSLAICLVCIERLKIRKVFIIVMYRKWRNKIENRQTAIVE